MTTGVAVMLLGVFCVPALLLWLGHGLRRRTERQRAVFWWALAGHIISIPIVTVAAFWPPAYWGANDLARGFAGFLSLVLLPMLGSAIGAFLAKRDAASN